MKSRTAAVLLAACCGGLGPLAGATGASRPDAAPLRSSSIDSFSSCGESGPLSYAWPIKPFDRPHPVRGNFGDPRTVFRTASIESDEGAFSFHNGIDISAPPGTAVYPVVSGTAYVRPGGQVVVRTGDFSTFHYRAFQYRHIVPAVRSGTHAAAGQTILGFVSAEAGHVHLTEIDDQIVENPLAPGHLRPYSDRVAPAVSSVLFWDSQGRQLRPLELRGVVGITARASDQPSEPVPGVWHGYPVTPAALSWRLETAAGARLLPEQTVADFRETLPAEEDFWRYYARGTYQNFPTLGSLYLYRAPGTYLFRLTRTPLDTEQLVPGDYRLVVTAADVCGNTGTLVEPIRVLPQPGSPSVPLTPAPLGRSGRGEPAYIVVLASVPTREGLRAVRERARSLRAALGRVGVLRSSRFGTLRPGYFVVFRGTFRTQTEASAAAIGIPGAYVREIVRTTSHVRRRPRRALVRWPIRRHGYTVVLASIPLVAGYRVAAADARSARRHGFTGVGILASTRFRSLTAGYFVIFSGFYRSAAAAIRTAERHPGTYPRLISRR